MRNDIQMLTGSDDRLCFVGRENTLTMGYADI